MFAFPQGGDGVGVVRITGEVETTDALDGDDFAGRNPCPRCGNDISDGQTAVFLEPDMWSAVGAGIGLCVETSVRWVVVLGLAAVAHQERGHGRERPVVRGLSGDGETGPTIGAVDERVAIAPVLWIVHFGTTVGTDFEIWRNQRGGVVVAPALDDDKVGVARRVDVTTFDCVDVGQRRRIGQKPKHEVVDGRPWAFEFNEDAGAVVADKSVEI